MPTSGFLECNQNFKYPKKFACGAQYLKKIPNFFFRRNFNTFAEICQLKKTNNSDSVKNQAETSQFQVYLDIAQH